MRQWELKHLFYEQVEIQSSWSLPKLSEDAGLESIFWFQV